MNYPYTSIKLIDGEIKTVVNKEAKPNVMINHPNYNDIMMLWQKNHEVFKFANPHEEGNIIRCIGGMNPKIKYAIEVTCIKVKSFFDDENKQHSFAYFKDDDKESIITSITQRIKDEQRKHSSNIENWHEIASRKIYSSFNITKKSHENEQ